MNFFSAQIIKPRERGKIQETERALISMKRVDVECDNLGRHLVTNTSSGTSAGGTLWRNQSYRVGQCKQTKNQPSQRII